MASNFKWKQDTRYVHIWFWPLCLLALPNMWTIMENVCSFGDAAIHTVDTESGDMFIAGTDGPDPVAISMDGQVLWKSEVNNPEIYGPYEITPEGNQILVKYESGMEEGYKLVAFDANGLLLSVHTEENGR